MENDKLLWDIESELEIFQAHIKRMRKNPEHMHAMDVDLLMEKTRKLYDKLYVLSSSLSKTKVAGNQEESKKQEPLEKETIRDEDTLEAKVDNSAELQSETAEKHPVVDEKQQEPSPVSANEKIELAAEEEKEAVEMEQGNDALFEEPKIESEPEKEKTVSEQVIEPEKEKSTAVKSAIDLFSDTVEETIADKFGNKEDPSIASKMQHRSINDLRQAIGINEKFLFINGLFNGDLGRYNKAIDEFNELSTKEGVNAHFLELKIHNQWSDDNEGVVKLKALLDRKFN